MTAQATAYLRAVARASMGLADLGVNHASSRPRVGPPGQGPISLIRADPGQSKRSFRGAAGRCYCPWPASLSACYPVMFWTR